MGRTKDKRSDLRPTESVRQKLESDRAVGGGTRRETSRVHRVYTGSCIHGVEYIRGRDKRRRVSLVHVQYCAS